jgi:ribose-phosphate pyrophosphokinase
VVLDPHSDAAAAAIDNFVAVPGALSDAKRVIIAAIAAGELMLVAPDAGSLKIHPVKRRWAVRHPR